MASFENTKSEIVSSGLGQALTLTVSNTWSQIVDKIKAIVNRGAVSQALNCGGSYTIPAGYHNGSGKVTANSLASQTDANAAAAQILSGFTAWIKGNKITGSMPNRGTLNWSGSNTTYSVPAGYYSGGTLDSRPSYNAGVAAADARVNTGSASYTSGYNAGHNAGITSGRQSIRLTRVYTGTKNSDRTATISVSSGRDYIVSFGGDPGQFQNFSVSGGTVLSKITGGDTPPDGTYFGLMALVRATSNSMTVNLGTGGSVYGFLISRVDYA